MAEGIVVSWHYVAKVWKDNGLRRHRFCTFKLSRDPVFADKVADVGGPHLDPPGGGVVLCVDPRLPLAWHDEPVRAFDTATGQAVGDC